MSDSLDALRSQLVSNLVKLMADKGENPTSLALKAGLNHRAVHDILQGRSKFPRADTLRALSLALAAAPETLLNAGSNTPNMYGTGTLGNTGQSGGYVAAAYDAPKPKVIEGVPAHAVPKAFKDKANMSSAQLYFLEAPEGGFPPAIPAGSWLFLDISSREKQVSRPGIYWVKYNEKSLLVRLSPDLAAGPGMVTIGFFDETTGTQAQTISVQALEITGRVQFVINQI